MYSPGGAYLKTIALPLGASPTSLSVAPDDTLWVADVNKQSIYHLTEAGTLLVSFSYSNFLADVAVDSSGNPWVSGEHGRMYHFTPTGTLISAFAISASTAPYAPYFALANDGTLYVDDQATPTNMYHYATNGTLLGSFPLSSPSTPKYISVVPVAIPEPSTLALSGIGAIGPLVYRWRRRRRAASQAACSR